MLQYEKRGGQQFLSNDVLDDIFRAAKEFRP
jgi:hypothetical protein